MQKVTKITPEQAAKFGEWAKKWIDIGLSTEPADFERATAAALKAYELCKLKRPMVILRMGSPCAATLGGAVAWSMLHHDHVKTNKVEFGAEIRSQIRDQVGDQIRDQVGDQIRDQVGDQVRDQVWEKVGDQVWEKVRNQVWAKVGAQVRAQIRDQIRDQVWAQIWTQVWAQIGDQVRDQVRDQVGAQVRDQVWAKVGAQIWTQVGAQVGDGVNNCYGGALWAPWDAHISFCRDVLGWQGSTLPNFEIGEELTKSCGWVWWHENVLAISDRPLKIHRDDQGRLHSLTGPSILYRDGWALYHSHGTSIPAEWITQPGYLTAKMALTCKNVEQRRAGCEILGWNSIIAELGGIVLNADPDPQIGELIEVNIPDIGKERFLRVQCGTGRSFALPVPPTMQTALEANAWGYDIPVDLLKQKEART